MDANRRRDLKVRSGFGMIWTQIVVAT